MPGTVASPCTRPPAGLHLAKQGECNRNTSACAWDLPSAVIACRISTLHETNRAGRNGLGQAVELSRPRCYWRIGSLVHVSLYLETLHLRLYEKYGDGWVYPLQRSALPCRIVVIEASPAVRLGTGFPRPFGFGTDTGSADSSVDRTVANATITTKVVGIVERQYLQSIFAIVLVEVGLDDNEFYRN